MAKRGRFPKWALLNKKQSNRPRASGGKRLSFTESERALLMKGMQFKIKGDLLVLVGEKNSDGTILLSITPAFHGAEGMRGIAQMGEFNSSLCGDYIFDPRNGNLRKSRKTEY